jgi:hypothetical protein
MANVAIIDQRISYLYGGRINDHKLAKLLFVESLYIKWEINTTSATSAVNAIAA